MHHLSQPSLHLRLDAGEQVIGLIANCIDGQHGQHVSINLCTGDRYLGYLGHGNILEFLQGTADCHRGLGIALREFIHALREHNVGEGILLIINLIDDGDQCLDFILLLCIAIEEPHFIALEPPRNRIFTFLLVRCILIEESCSIEHGDIGRRAIGLHTGVILIIHRQGITLAQRVNATVKLKLSWCGFPSLMNETFHVGAKDAAQREAILYSLNDAYGSAHSLR